MKLKVSYFLFFFAVASLLPSLYASFQDINLKESSYIRTTTFSIDLENCSWDHVNINVLLIPNSSSWFDEKYLVFARLAIDSWKASINAYTNAYGASYLNKITFNVFVLDVNFSSHYDIYIRFYKEITDGIAGFTDYRYYKDSGKLVNATIVIASEVYGEKLSYTQIRNVVAHEIGHSLGLGHASQESTINGPELMYYSFDLSSTVQDTIYPSTLDIYALSVIYKWLETGIYESVNTLSVSLPNNIPYKEAVYFRLNLVNAYGSNVTSGWYLFENYVYISVNETYKINSTFRYRFIGWIGKGSGSYSGSSRSFYIKIIGDVSEEAIWIPQYFVNVTPNYLSFAYGSGWYDNNSIAKVSTVPRFKNESYVMYTFYSWSGSIQTNQQNFSFLVNRPISLHAIWKCYYYVNINFDKYTNFSSGWYENGTSIILKAEEIVTFNNKSRLIFMSWNHSSKDPLIQINVMKPMNLSPIYYVQYFITISGGVGKVLNSSSWAFKGETVTILSEYFFEVSKVERYVFLKWVGSCNSSSNVLKVYIDGPKEFEAVWKKQFYVNATSPLGFVNGSGWYDQGSYAKIVVYPTSEGLLILNIFEKWSGDIESSNSSLTVRIDGPKVLIARWKKDYSRVIILVSFLLLLFILFAKRNFKLSYRFFNSIFGSFFYTPSNLLLSYFLKLF
ncbi:MAG: zinc-dependent metalloprotease family protein [Thermoproteota archaeon]|nr:hypothetical protein [Candidatus Brockarchaeota archaeon]